MSSRGFSLVEVILTIVILAIVGGFTFHFLSTETRTYVEMERARRAHQEAAAIAERISRELRDSSGPVVCQATNLVSFMRAHPTPQDSDLYVAFRRSSGNVYRDSCSASPCSSNGPLMGAGVTALTCTVLPPGCTQNCGYQIGVSVNYEGRSQTYTLAVFPKNYPTRYVANSSTSDCNDTPPTGGGAREFCGRNFGNVPGSGGGGNYEDKIY
jgi:prepilin-type N-terminal cleavage/methylation domain-containing protein